MVSPVEALEEAAPAKVNLFLEVRGRRPGDGYHLIESLVVFARDACDQLGLTLEGGGGGAPLRAVGVGETSARPGLPGSPSVTRLEGPMARSLEGPNLVDAAVARVCQAAADIGLRLPHLSFTLDKRLPVAAGVGGGSADAAACLRLIARAFPELARRLDWPALALQLGADVPVCLAGQAALMTGIGERLAPMRLAGGLYGVLVNPRLAVATRTVFAQLAAPMLEPAEALRAVEPATIGALGQLAEGGHGTIAPAVAPAVLIAWLASRRNDLEAPALALVPAMAEVREALEGLAGRRLVRMSGSGATWFALFEEAAAATAGAEALARLHPHWWVAASRLS